MRTSTVPLTLEPRWEHDLRSGWPLIRTRRGGGGGRGAAGGGGGRGGGGDSTSVECSFTIQPPSCPGPRRRDTAASPRRCRPTAHTPAAPPELNLVPATQSSSCRQQRRRWPGKPNQCSCTNPSDPQQRAVRRRERRRGTPRARPLMKTRVRVRARPRPARGGGGAWRRG